MRNWLWLPISAAVAASAAAAPPEKAALTFELLRNGGEVAGVVHTLEHDGRRYEITEKWSGKGFYALAGSATRTSRGLVSPGGLRPLEFKDERTGRSTARATFDWEAKTIVLQYKGEPRTEPLPPQANDRLAFLYDFAFEATRPKQAEFELFDGRGRSHHVYQLDGHERITVPAGSFDTVRYVRSTGDERADIWLGADIGYLPVRVLITKQDGERFDQRLKELSRP